MRTPKVVAAAVCAIVMFGGLAFNLALADPGDDCAFDCTNPTDPWTQNGSTTEALWVVVKALPIDDTSGTPPDLIRWHQLSTTTKYWPTLDVEVTWESSGGVKLIQQKLVKADGTCNAGNTSLPSGGAQAGAPDIRCHKGVDEDDDFLCDSFTGVWDRLTEGTGIQCVTEARYGFDMKRVVTIGGVNYEWKQIHVEPDTTGLGAGQLLGVESCSLLTPWKYNNTDGITHDGDDTVDLYRNGSASGIYITLHYPYEEF